MYSRKSVGTRMGPWGTPASTRRSCEDFPSRTTRSRLLYTEKRIKNFVKQLELWTLLLPVAELGKFLLINTKSFISLEGLKTSYGCFSHMQCHCFPITRFLVIFWSWKHLESSLPYCFIAILSKLNWVNSIDYLVSKYM